MAKFKIRMKLENFEIEMEGDRQDVPQMTSGIATQLAGFLEPAAQLAADSPGRKAVNNDAPQPESAVQRQASAKKRSRSASNSGTKGATLDWVHDGSKWGNPMQSWNPTKKSLWLLYVASQEVKVTQMTPGSIANTFNKHFKQAGTIRASNVSRDLGKAKMERPSLVGQDTTNNDEFFLTDAGKTFASNLVAEARGDEVSAS